MNQPNNNKEPSWTKSYQSSSSSNHATINEDLLKSVLLSKNTILQEQQNAKDDNNNSNNNNQKDNDNHDVFVNVTTNLTSLELSFQNISNIDHLQTFQNLTKLCLDNNHIRKIEQLQDLIHLTWLDLSFNQISKIEHLDALTELQDLSLFHNQIQKMENLESQFQSLQCLSLGYNRISWEGGGGGGSSSNIEMNVNKSSGKTHTNDMEETFWTETGSYLRKFQCLKVLTFMENPISTSPEYESWILSSVLSLTYLDYKLVPTSNDHNNVSMQAKRSTTSTTHQNDINGIKSDEISNNVHSFLTKNWTTSVKDIISKMMVTNDITIGSHTSQSVTKEILSSFDSKVKEASRVFVDVCMNRDEKRQNLVDNTDDSLTQIRTNATAQATSLIDDFLALYKDDVSPSKNMNKEKHLTILCNDLMEQEIIFNKEMEDAMKCLGEAINVELKNRLQCLTNYFQSIVRICEESFTCLTKTTQDYYSEMHVNDTESKSKYNDQKQDSDKMGFSLEDALSEIKKKNEQLLNDLQNKQEKTLADASAFSARISSCRKQSVRDRHRDRINEIDEFKAKMFSTLT